MGFKRWTRKRFGRAREGAAAAEFALIVPWFAWITLGLAEVSLMGLAQSSMDYAMSEVAREIRTGEVQTAGLSQSQLKTEICDKLNQFMAMSCSNLYLDIRSFPGFVNVTNTNPLNSSGQLQSGTFVYQPGGPSDIVLVRGFYTWDIITPLMQSVFGNVGGTQRLISSSILFRNEPWPAAPPPSPPSTT